MTASAPAREFSRYLDAIVDLTRQNDSRELMSALLGMLSRSVQAQHVRMFVISNPNHDTNFNQSNIQHAVVVDQFDSEFGEPRPLGEDADLVACVCSGKLIERQVPDGRRVVFPIFGTRHIRALLVIDGLGDEPIPYELLAKLLQVYSNQTLMLSRSELDPLTGLYNRQTFDDRLRRAAQRASRPTDWPRRVPVLRCSTSITSSRSTTSSATCTATRC